LGDNLLLAEIFERISLEFNSEVLEDGLHGGLVDADLSSLQHGGTRASPGEEDELGPLGIVIGSEVHAHQSVVDAVLLKEVHSLVDTARSLASNNERVVVLVGEHNPVGGTTKVGDLSVGISNCGVANVGHFVVDIKQEK